MFNLFSAKDMGIDLGTANTLIYIKDKGIVLNEPSVIAMDNRRGVTLAVGSQAKDMIGKAPANISVIRPLEDGVISDFDRTADMLKAFIEKAAATNKVKNFRVVVGVPSGVTEVEKRAVEETVRNMGASEVYILEEPMAAAIGAGLDVDSSTACMIADIGGGTTDIAIIALGGIVASSSIRHAGDKFNDAIIQYMRKRHALLIGEKTAEYLKIQVGAACLDLDENGDEIITTVNASGRDIISGLPKILEVSNRDIMMALQESVDIIVDGVKATIEKAPPEIAADIAANGMLLSGGGGMIHNLDQMIEKRTGVKANIAENAFEAVAMGTGMSLNNIEKLKIYATSINRR
ncbi:rod shape-determining protein [Anaerovoracaceae bacterium 41-7]|jgi:rod shape-determining protein MreB|uniref:Cell shape-determining protein MreB n=1 Tax=Anaerotruncus colihominis TaxID=169435 RepID=A0A845QJ33_9FIRM|nr:MULTISPECIES: rod shape-determining protein [Clostridia]MCI9475580.1 rod shape-determining protein [Emergencia sp.]MCI9639700.1 rod shape-determining protein [Emergencia sp.]NBH61015.1 rod shape-determining protein [Anaerotruncus colihominis]NCE98537.1 rod shape-determining protein [Emergencia sp. 1XD21-10]NCF01670.1 rod shape-determining protein [Anaerotruncus sp. 80]